MPWSTWRGEPIAAGRWSAARRERIEASRWTGTANLVRGLTAADPRPGVLLAGSAVGYYGDRGDQSLTEDAAPGGRLPGRGVGPLGAGSRSGGEAGNPGGAFAHRCGAGSRGWRAAAHGRAVPRRGGRTPGATAGSGMPWVHVDDVVGLIRLALTDDRLRGPLNLVAPGGATNAELTRALGRALRRPAFMIVPALALKLLFGGMSETLLASQRVIPAAAVQAGYRFRYPRLDAALADLLG